MQDVRGRSKLLGIACVLGSAACFGIMPIWAKQAYTTGLTPLQLVIVRMAVAAAALLFVLRARGERLDVPRPAIKRLSLICCSYAAMTMTFFYACQGLESGLANALFHLYPAVIVAMSSMLNGRRPSVAGIVAVSFAIAGSALMVDPMVGGADVRYIALALVAAAFYGVYATLLEDGEIAQISPFKQSFYIAVTSLVGALCAYACCGGGLFVPVLGGLAYAALIGVVSTVAALALYITGTRRLGAPVAGVLSNVETVFTPWIGSVALGELVGPADVAGCMLIALSGVLACL